MDIPKIIDRKTIFERHYISMFILGVILFILNIFAPQGSGLYLGFIAIIYILIVATNQAIYDFAYDNYRIAFQTRWMKVKYLCEDIDTCGDLKYRLSSSLCKFVYKEDDFVYKILLSFLHIMNASEIDYSIKEHKSELIIKIIGVLESKAEDNLTYHEEKIKRLWLI